MSVPVFIDLVEAEQVSELRCYLKEKGAEISEENAPDGLLRDITQVIEASTICLKDSTTEPELESIFNSIVSLILIIPLDQSEQLVAGLCEKIVKSTAPDKKNTSRMKILSNLFHGLDEHSPHRYLVYTAMVKLAGQADLLHMVNTNMDDIKSWAEMWEVDRPSVQVLLRHLHDAFLLCSHREKATKVMIELLSTYTNENASQARDDAHRCIVTCLADPDTFIMDHLLMLMPVRFLEGELIHDLLTIFISGKLQQYCDFYETHKDFVTSLGLLHNDNLQKMRLLTLMLMAEDQQQIDFTTMQRELQLPADEIEAFVIDVVRTRAVRAQIDHVAQRVVITSTTHRTFGQPQWLQLRSRLHDWQHHLGAVLESLQTVTPT